MDVGAEGAATSIEENKKLVRRFYEEVDKDAMDEFVAEARHS